MRELSLKQQTVTIAEGTITDLLKKVNRLEKQIEGLNNFANERFEEIERVRKERDDARNTVDRLTQTGLDLMDSNKSLKNKIKKILNKNERSSTNSD
jgi:chromosome segregation ATPase